MTELTALNESLEQKILRIAASAVDANKKNSYFRGALYGPSGVGKSVLAAMILRSIIKSDEGFILDIDTSEGYVSWRNHPGLNKGIKIIPFTNLGDVRAIVQGIQQGISVKIGDELFDLSKCRGLILDEFSKMVEIDVLRIHEARERGEFGKSGTQAGPSGSKVPEGWDYQFALQRFRVVNAEIHDLRNLNIITIAHQSEKKDKRGNTIGVFPSYPPKIAQNMKEAIHLVAHITGRIVNDPANPGRPVAERKAQVYPSVLVDAKCRLGIQQTSINADLLPQLIKKWIEEGGVVLEDDNEVREDEITQEEFNEVTKDMAPQDILTAMDNGEISTTTTEDSIVLDEALDIFS